MKAENLPFADGEFDVATAIEVLEHVPTRSTPSPRWRAWPPGWLLVSVPREPLWRGLNMARGAYLKDLGNTPGPPQPLVQARLRRSCSPGTATSSRRARRSRGRCCSCALATRAEPGAAGRTDGYARGARILSHRDRVDRALHVRLLRRRQSHVLGEDEYGAISLLWAVLFVVISVIYRPVEQLLSRTIADAAGAGARGGHPLRAPATIQRRSRRCSSSSRSRCAARSRRRLRRVDDALLGARRRDARLRRQLLRPRLARRAPVVRPLRRAGAVRVGLAVLLPARRGAWGSRAGRPRWRWASPRRRWRRCWSCRGRSAPRRGRRTPRAARR